MNEAHGAKRKRPSLVDYESSSNSDCDDECEHPTKIARLSYPLSTASSAASGTSIATLQLANNDRLPSRSVSNSASGSVSEDPENKDTSEARTSRQKQNEIWTRQTADTIRSVLPSMKAAAPTSGSSKRKAHIKKPPKCAECNVEHPPQCCPYHPPANGKDCLSTLSDELLLRILKSLNDYRYVLTAGLVSKRLHRLSTEGDVWRGLYWMMFLRNKSKRSVDHDRSINDDWAKWEIEEDAKQEKGWVKRMGEVREDFLPRLSVKERIEEDIDGMGGPEVASNDQRRIPWLQKYRLHWNWGKGRAKLRTLTGFTPSVSGKYLARLESDILITVDPPNGLQAWDLRNGIKRIAQYSFGAPSEPSSPSAEPTAIKLETKNRGAFPKITIGFTSGGWALFALSWPGAYHTTDISKTGRFALICSAKQEKGQSQLVQECAYMHPLVLSIDGTQTLRVYTLSESDDAPPPLDSTRSGTAKALCVKTKQRFGSPKLRRVLSSHSSWAPLRISLKHLGIHADGSSATDTIVAHIAYPIPSFHARWSVGVQELHLTPSSGDVKAQRLSTAVAVGWSDVSGTYGLPQADIGDRPGWTGGEVTCLSFDGSDIITGHADNTTSFYLLVDATAKLGIRHVGGAQEHDSRVEAVCSMHRSVAGLVAVSVDRGGEVKMWLGDELGPLRRVPLVISGKAEDGEGTERGFEDEEEAKPWLGSDEVRVAVIRKGRLAVYDFT